MRRVEAQHGCKQRANCVVVCRCYWRTDGEALPLRPRAEESRGKSWNFSRKNSEFWMALFFFFGFIKSCSTFLFKQATGRWAELFVRCELSVQNAKCYFSLSRLWNFPQQPLRPGLGECSCSLLKLNEAQGNAKLWSDCGCVSTLHQWEAVNTGLNMLI